MISYELYLASTIFLLKFSTDLKNEFDSE